MIPSPIERIVGDTDRIFTQQFALVDSSHFRTSVTIGPDLLYVCQSIRSGLGSVPCEGRKQQ